MRTNNPEQMFLRQLRLNTARSYSTRIQLMLVKPPRLVQVGTGIANNITLSGLPVVTPYDQYVFQIVGWGNATPVSYKDNTWKVWRISTGNDPEYIVTPPLESDDMPATYFSGGSNFIATGGVPLGTYVQLSNPATHMLTLYYQ